ncbi:MAG TPA: hypothetical protein VFQ53_10970 [Kofleriaceae bacterium]|nr:hypothetical protein [Kofleriaceae bacterium]
MLALATSLATMSIAHADTRAEAVALFDQGQKEMKAGNYEKACKSFETSMSLVPDTGTKGSLARCYEKLGKLATSWLLWRELADTAPSPDLRKDAADKAAKLDPRVPKYVVKVASVVPGMQVTINGKQVDPAVDVPVPIDPGPVVAIATAPGHDDWKSETNAAEGGTLVIEVPVLVAKKVDAPPPVDDRAKRRRTRHLIGGIVGGVGVGAVAGGVVFGLSARGKYADAKDTCGGSIDACIPGQLDAAQAQVDDARKAANLSSILFAVGGAAVIGGAVIWFTAPSAEKPTVALTPTVSAGSAGFVLSGRF